MQTYRQIASSDIATAGGELTANAMPLAGGVLLNGDLSAGSVTPTGGSSQTLAYWLSTAGLASLLASPPAIGGTTPAAGSFTTLSATGGISGSAVSAIAPGCGYASINCDNQSNSGYLAFFNSSGVRQGYIGFASNAGGPHNIQSEGSATGYAMNGLLTVGGTLTVSGATTLAGLTVASGGIYLGSALAASVTDLSKHISLYGDTLGFSITGGRLNTVVPAGMLAVTNVGGTDILTVASTGATVTNMTVTGTLTAASYVAPGATSNIGRNRIDNGNMEIAQRTLPVAANGAYGLDRWVASWSSGTASVSQGAYGGYTSRKQLVLAITGLTSGTTAGAYHRIEAARSCDLAGQTVTVQFNATLTNTGTGGTFSVQPYYAGSLDNFAGNVAIGSPIPFTLSGTPVTYTATFAVPSAAVNGLQLNFLITQGTTGNIAFVITSVQLEAGAAATAFERLDPVLNLQRCQRFYQNSSYQIQAYHLGGSYCSYVGAYPVQLRATPTIAVASISNVNCSVGTVSAGPGSDGNSYYTINVGVTATGGCNCAGTFTASADL